jgi:hypothetical protein
MDCCYKNDKNIFRFFKDSLPDKRIDNLELLHMYARDDYFSSKILIFQCKVCNQKYIYNPETQTFSTLVDNQSILLEHWYNYDNSNISDFYNQLKIIGSTPESFERIKLYGGLNNLNFPCKVLLKNNKTVDFCNLKFYSNPTFIDNIFDSSSIYFLHDVAEIYPSDYSFSKEIRFRIHNNLSDDIIMPGYRDINVYGLKNNNNEIFKIAASTDFFSKNQLKGADFKLLDGENDLLKLKNAQYVESDSHEYYKIIGSISFDNINFLKYLIEIKK